MVQIHKELEDNKCNHKNQKKEILIICKKNYLMVIYYKWLKSKLFFF